MIKPVTADLLSYNQLILLIIGGLVLAVAIFGSLAAVISLVNYQDKPARDRLLMLKEKSTKTSGSSESIFADLKEALLIFSMPISQALYGQNKKYRQKVKFMLSEAGLSDQEAQINRFIAQRAATGLVIGVIGCIVAFILSLGMFFVAATCLLAGFIAGSLLPGILLKNKAGKRKTEIRYTLSDTLDLMVVCVEAGLGLDATIQRVAEETERLAPDISQEFKRLNKELNAGISRVEAFQNLGLRSGVDEMRSLCAMIVQSDKMGTSVADTLRVYANDLRVKRRQKAEELASKASIKMTFPLVLFIFPPLFIILIGPIVITTIKSFMK